MLDETATTVPYLSLTRAVERRLLAALATAALPDHALSAVARSLVQADSLAAWSDTKGSLK